MSARLFTLSMILALVLAPAATVFAQNRSSGMSAFGNGMSGMGGGMGGGSGFGNSMGGMSGGMGGSGGFGSGGMGGMGGSGFGGNSSFGRSGGGNSSFGNSGFGNSGFGGGQQGGGQSFVGRDATDMQGTFQQTSKAQTQFFNNMNRQMSRNNNRDRKAKTVSNPAQPMRMEVKVAFSPTRPTSDAVAQRVQSRLTKILADHHMTQPLVTVQGDTAVISGAATSDSERQVIAQLVSLESGVRSVRNEMTVPGESTEGIVPPTGN